MAALLATGTAKKKDHVVTIINRAKSASTIYPELSFGKFRGIWLDQVFDDAGLTGDETRALRAVTTFMRQGKKRNGKQIQPDNRTPCPGFKSIKLIAHVSFITVRRAIDKAEKNGHLIVKQDGRLSPRILIPIIEGYDPKTGLRLPESAQKEQSQSFDDEPFGPSETGQNVHTESDQKEQSHEIESAHLSAHLSAQKRAVKPACSSTKSDVSASALLKFREFSEEYVAGIEFY